MSRAAAFILTLTLLAAMVINPAQRFGIDRDSDISVGCGESSPASCCCGEDVGTCPCCSHPTSAPARSGRPEGCPCAPAPAPNRGGGDLDRSTPIAAAPVAVKRQVRQAARVRTQRQTLPDWIAARLVETTDGYCEARCVAVESPPLRAALCIWTT